MKKQAIIELVEKISSGVATDKEILQYNDWYESLQQKDGEWGEEEFGDQIKIEAELLRRINRRINGESKSHLLVMFSLRNIAAAVITIVLAVGGLYSYFSNKETMDAPIMVIQEDIQPGGDKAVLTLDDGSQIILDEAKMGILASEGSTSVQKKDKGLIAYQTGLDNIRRDDGQPVEVKFNTISTPQGGQYKIVLPDESEVWLNALSSIRFPTSFEGDSRNVDITGEVYFEVKEDTLKPFLVKTPGQTIKVLGTQFNINAYENEPAILTTLVEGSIEVVAGNRSIRIQPGQQTVNDKYNKMNVQKVNTDQVIAWKDGLFQFWNTDLQEIMRQLSRWYGVEVDYLNETNDKSFSGFIGRDVPLSNVLHMLEEAGNVNFGLNGKTVYVNIEKD